MNCPKCNHNPDDAGRFCPICGVRLSAATALTPGQISYESLEAIFRANDWTIFKDEEESQDEEESLFRVKFKESYDYLVRLHQGLRITFSTSFRMSESVSAAELHKLANALNTRSFSTITAVVEYESGARWLVATISILMDRSISFSDVERHFLHAEREWGVASIDTDLAKMLYRAKSED